MNILPLVGRTQALMEKDLARYDAEVSAIVAQSRFLVIGGAGSIGQAVAKEIFKRDPKVLHVVDISENNMVELVRDLRSSIGYGSGELATFALDCGSPEFGALVAGGAGYDYVFNLSALKHVRSEKDPFTLMRLIQVNIFNTLKTLEQTAAKGSRKYFCVSTDKAANPVNMMGASKRIMERFLFREGGAQDVSMARFANVAFSDGSLLHGFNQRLLKRQPLSAPSDVLRYFVTPEEAGVLCLLSGVLGDNREIFFPKLSEDLHLTSFSDIALRYLEDRGYTPLICDTEEEARLRATEIGQTGHWPCYFFKSDTTGEKDFEEFFMPGETLDMERFDSLGVIQNGPALDTEALDAFARDIAALRARGTWKKEDIVTLFNRILPEFSHVEKNKNLDQRM